MKNFKILCFCACIVALTSCKKYLDIKSSTTLAVASTLDDVQKILDNDTYNSSLPTIGEGFSDNYYYLEPLNPLTQNLDYYTWGDALYQNDGSVSPWGLAYAKVYSSNIVLETLGKLNETAENRNTYRNIKGMAYFYRSFYFFKLAEGFTNSYEENASNTDLGIPIRLKSDIEAPSVRATVRQTYDQIIADGLAACAYLPTTQVAITRPSKATAYGLMARVYLSMRNYKKAGMYADSCLKLHSDLLDYNTLNPSSSAPIKFPCAELISYTTGSGGGILFNPVRAPVDTNLYKSYIDIDLRKSVFFNKKSENAYYFKASYSQTFVNIYAGITSSEMYLTRAECFARDGDIFHAMEDLNTLMKNRILKTAFTPYTAGSAQQALQIVLVERRKELVFRDLRWMDIKRLNREGANISVTRVVKGRTYILPANSPRFALPLPTSVINLTGMPQNPK